MTACLSVQTISDLYEEDYYLWLETTCQQLQERDVNRLDWEHLMEEVAALGNEQRRKAESYLRQVLIHLLLYYYWDSQRSYCAKGWENEIGNFRSELEFLLRSKTLYNYCSKQLDVVYEKARKAAIKKTELSPHVFPSNCPFSLSEILDPDYLPPLS
jgi:hypothetical protein